jgi:myo-inositol-1(or 4)-monophosphatase
MARPAQHDADALHARSLECPMHPMLNIAVKAARRAGSIINRAALEGAFEVRAKNRNDFVTQVDRAAEQAIVEIIRRAYPGHAVLAEESGASAGARDEYRWVIDPLDGTTNFIHGFPQYCVSIALQHKDVLTQAVVYDPGKNELFTASRGRGAFLDDRRIRVSKCADLKDALVGTGFPFKELGRLDLYLRQLRALMGGSAGVRRAGSAALDLAYVAAGRLDAFWEMGLSPWDMAAGALLIQEAGGLASDLEGNAAFMESGDIVAATPKLLPQLLSALK